MAGNKVGPGGNGLSFPSPFGKKPAADPSVPPSTVSSRPQGDSVNIKTNVASSLNAAAGISAPRPLATAEQLKDPKWVAANPFETIRRNILVSTNGRHDIDRWPPHRKLGLLEFIDHKLDSDPGLKALLDEHRP